MQRDEATDGVHADQGRAVHAHALQAVPRGENQGGEGISRHRAYQRRGSCRATRGAPGDAGVGELPATWALGQHASDLVVHAWDVARATGNTQELDPELAEAALALGRANLKPEFRGQAFRARDPRPRECTRLR